ncbi:MAG: NADH-quinone oxidoreductase subunit H, partial [Anaplasmataceae bacterium]|nr:NADH-quinone oxidoreductase subunit H [Anaplasmataceae bacterium]
MIEFIIDKLLIIVCVLIPLVLSVAYLVYYERKLLGSLQLRTGPEVLGFKGTLQPFADALKLMFKEVIFPIKARKFLFILAPIIAFVTAIIGWAVIPFSVITLEDGTIIPKVIANINIGFMYLLAVGALEVYGVIIAGWASNSNYAFLGALRSAAQMISYEVSMGLIIACVLLFAGTMNIAEFVIIKHAQPFWVDIFLFPLSIVFFISILAETNRHPFDLPEAESELVSGYNVEYSSIPFVLFFFGEYANM